MATFRVGQRVRIVALPAWTEPALRYMIGSEAVVVATQDSWGYYLIQSRDGAKAKAHPHALVPLTDPGNQTLVEWSSIEQIIKDENERTKEIVRENH